MIKKIKSIDGKGILILTISMLIILKLTGIISISWYYVTSPLWSGLLISFVGFCIYRLYKLLKSKKSRVPKMINPPNQPIKK